MSPRNRRSRSISPLEEAQRSTQHQRTRLRKQPDCRLCKKDHPLRTCHKFKSMNVIKRQQAVKTYRYCENCLAHSHLLRNCRSRERCRLCKARHHTLLHRHTRLKNHQLNNDNVLQPLSTLRSVILTPTVIIKIQFDNEWYNIRGILDPCTETSQIAEFIPDRYKLHTEKTGSHTLCKIVFKPHFGDGPIFTVLAKVSTTLPRKTRSDDIDERIADQYKNLRLADPKFYKCGDINVILGADVYPKIVKPIIHQETLTTPMAQDTLLGWTLIGKFGI